MSGLECEVCFTGAVTSSYTIDKPMRYFTWFQSKLKICPRVKETVYIMTDKRQVVKFRSDKHNSF